jgi:hypothetical protein
VAIDAVEGKEGNRKKMEYETDLRERTWIFKM